MSTVCTQICENSTLGATRRFSFVDVPFQIALQTEYEKGLEKVNFKYDVACKFNINAYNRCMANPHSPLELRYRLRLKKENGFIKYDVNDFHIYSHIPQCADEYGSAYTPLMGVRACEEIEAIWSILNAQQYGTREMDAGARRDQLTAAMLHLNMGKMNKMRESFARNAG